MASIDDQGSTFLHHFAKRHEKTDALKEVILVIPKEIARVLASMKNKEAHTIQRWSKVDLNDFIDCHCVSEESYPLARPPRCLIFYSTKNRKEESEEEKDHIVSYFSERSLPFEVIKNPITREIFAKVSRSTSQKNLSGLIVFVLSHGVKGSVQVEDGLLEIREIINQMCSGTYGKPKVCHTEQYV